MGRKKCWEQNFAFMKNYGSLDPNMSKNGFLGIYLIFWSGKLKKWVKMGKNQKSVPNIFSDMFLSRSQPIFSSSCLFGLKLLIVF